MNIDVHTHVMKRLALLPDEKLTHLLHAVKGAGDADGKDGHASRSERVELISRELRERGIFGPPWWSGARR